MKFPDLFPPSDLLEQVEGIERSLHHSKRLGRLGWVGALISGLQVAAILFKSEWMEALRKQDSRQFSTQLLQDWLLLAAVTVLACSILLINWNRLRHVPLCPACWQGRKSGVSRDSR